MLAKIWSIAIKDVKTFSWICGLVFHQHLGMFPLNVGRIFHTLYGDHRKYKLDFIKRGGAQKFRELNQFYQISKSY